jgi:hypothetical protein
MKRISHLNLTSIRQSGKSRIPGMAAGCIFLLAGMSLLLTQCNRADDVEQNMLFGKWVIFKAERNGNETPYLRNGYMIINPDGFMTVNITGTDEKGKYVLDKQIVRMNDTEEFVIRSIKGDSMMIHYQASPQSEFMFYMHRHEHQVQ